MSVTPPLYRPEATAELDAGAQLDNRLRTTSVRIWIALIVLVAVILAGIAWGVFGSAPHVVVGRGAPGLDRLFELAPLDAELMRQRLEKGELRRGAHLRVMVEHFARQGGAGGLAAARQHGFAGRDHVGGLSGRIVGPWREAEQAAAALGDRGEKIGKE